MNSKQRIGFLILMAVGALMSACGPSSPGVSSKEQVSSSDAALSSSSSVPEVPSSSEVSSSDASLPSSSEDSSSDDAPVSSSKPSSSSELFSDPDLAAYYEGVEGTGLTLLKSLREAISSPFKSLGYDGLWNAYQSTDSEDGEHINDYYSNITNYTMSDKDSGSHKKEGSAFNREHSIPKSWWGGGKSNQGCDVYIVVPTDGYVNERRSNYPFGETDGEDYSSANAYSKLGDSTFSGYSGTVFEPGDDRKGDFARIYFYALTRWDNAASWTEGAGSAVFSGSYSSNFGLTSYAKNLFLKWHEEDPVSDYEIRKNDAAEELQGNRNPYVDNPSWVEDIWGD